MRPERQATGQTVTRWARWAWRARRLRDTRGPRQCALLQRSAGIGKGRHRKSIERRENCEHGHSEGEDGIQAESPRVHGVMARGPPLPACLVQEISFAAPRCKNSHADPTVEGARTHALEPACRSLSATHRRRDGGYRGTRGWGRGRLSRIRVLLPKKNPQKPTMTTNQKRARRASRRRDPPGHKFVPWRTWRARRP